jgi:hypothetical protein
MQQKVHYVLSVFRQIYQTGDLVPEVGYSRSGNSKIRITPGNIAPLTERKPILIRPEKIIWKQWKGHRIPFFFEPHERELIVQNGDQWIIDTDIIASAFFLLSGWQEYHSTETDAYGRFPFSESVQKKLDILHIPVVNYYLDILKTVIEKACNISIKPYSWGAHDFAVFLSHDIDTCQSAWIEGSYRALRNGNLGDVIRLLYQKARGRDAWFNFQEILELEKQYGAASTFFFIARRHKNLGIKNADYDVTRPAFRKVFDDIIGSGSEVGIHGSTGTHLDAAGFRSERDRFTTTVSGNRFHFLLYDPVKTPAVLEKSGILYDSSIGFVEEAGFRSSFCFPYRPYDILNDRPYTYYEIPLMLMDGTLQKYLGLSPREGMNYPDLLISEIRKFGGCFSFLWHNTHFSAYKYPGWREVYKTTLGKLRDKNAFMSSGSEIINAFSKRKKS